MFRRRARARTHDSVVGANEVLALRIARLRSRAERGEGPDELVDDCLAVTAAAAARVTGAQASEDDLEAGLSLCADAAWDDEHIADPALVLALPAVFYAVLRNSVHLISPTQCDAAGRAAWLRPVAALLGLRVDLLDPQDDLTHRAARYDVDIVCGQFHEFAYDVLRDSLAMAPDERVSVTYDVAVIDEIDTVLLEQGESTPRISAPVRVDGDWHRWADVIARQLERDRHVDIWRREAKLLPAGVDHLLGSVDLADIYQAHVPAFNLVEAAVTARQCYCRGRDYEISDGEIVAIGASPPPDIMTAIAVREGLPLTTAPTILAMTSGRHHILRYGLVTGIGVVTGTTARQLRKVYRLRARAKRHDDSAGQDILVEDDAARAAVVLDAIESARAAGHQVLLAAGRADAAGAIMAGVNRAEHVTVVGPNDPVPEGRYDLMISLSRHTTRARDIRLARAADVARFYLTRAELEAMAGRFADYRLRDLDIDAAQPVSTPRISTLVAQLQDEAERARFDRDEFNRGVHDIREAHHQTLMSACAALTEDDDLIDAFRHLTEEHLGELIHSYRKRRLTYSELLDTLGTLYPCTLPPHPPANLADAIHADVERALTERTNELNTIVGEAAMEDLVRRVVLSVRERYWRWHLADLDTLVILCRGQHPKRRASEFRARADERFNELWPQLRAKIIEYTYSVQVENAPRSGNGPFSVPAPASPSARTERVVWRSGRMGDEK